METKLAKLSRFLVPGIASANQSRTGMTEHCHSALGGTGTAVAEGSGKHQSQWGLPRRPVGEPAEEQLVAEAHERSFRPSNCALQCEPPRNLLQKPFLEPEFPSNLNQHLHYWLGTR